MQKLKSKKGLLITACMFVILGVLGIVFTINAQTTTASADALTEDLNFTLYNNNTEYRVAARNKNLTEATIPAVYNGLPVTEVADNSFTNCTSLQKVFVPSTVTRIGNNAFSNCTALERISGMSKVQAIGNNAFASCAKLDKLILPSGIQSLGRMILRNNPNEVYVRMSEPEIMALNSAWATGRTATAMTTFSRTEIVYDSVCDDNGEEIAYEIIRWQNVVADEDVIIYSSHNGLPVTNIQWYAFADSTVHSVTVKHDENENFSHTVNINSGAFNNVNAEYIDIEVDVSFDDIGEMSGKSVDVFASAQMNRITLPDSLTFIPASMFSGCWNLQEIRNTNPNIEVNHLSEKITSIDEMAFNECQSLETLYIPASVTYMGNGVFGLWGDSYVQQTVQFNMYAPGANWDMNWQGTLYQNASIKFMPRKVPFNRNGGEGGSDYVEVGYGEDMPEGLTAPTRVGHNFKGYYGTDGKRYYDEEMHGVPTWYFAEETELKADWGPITYTVQLDPQGGSDGTTTTEATYLTPMLEGLVAPERPGYTFDGYYRSPNGEGTQYYDADMQSAHEWNVAADTTLYANWDAIEYTITYKVPGWNMSEVESPNPAVYTTDKAFNIEDFDYAGYRFTWATHKIEKDTIGNIEIEGTATIITYTITYAMGGGENNAENPTTYTVEDTVTLKEPFHKGYPFEGWYLNDEQVTEISGYTGDITLTAQWGETTEIIVAPDAQYIEATAAYTTIILPEQLNQDSVLKPDCVISVVDSVVRLYIVGTVDSIYKIRIRHNFTASAHIDLVLENVCMHPSFGASAIEMRHSISLYTYGKVEICGGKGAYINISEGFYPSNEKYVAGPGYAGIQCKALYIQRADNLLIMGGDGAQGRSAGKSSENGEKGGDAGSAVIIANGEIFVVNCANVTLKAGQAGKGGDGYSSTSASSKGGEGGKGAKAVVYSNGEEYPVVPQEGVTYVDSQDGENGTDGKRVIDPWKPDPIFPDPNPPFPNPPIS